MSKIKTKKNGGSFPDSTSSLLDRKVWVLTKAQKSRRRSYLRGKLEALGYQVNVKFRTIRLKEDSLDEIPIPARYYVHQLLRMGFTKQLTLF